MLKLIRFLLVDICMLILVVYVAVFSELVLYGLAQGKGQLRIISQVRPVEEVMKDPTFPDSLKKKLILIKEIRQYASDSLGLKPSSNYSTIYDQHGKPVLWTITASEPFRLKAKEWYFPFLGSVSYKGFFNYEKGKKEAALLEAKGYDVDYGAVSGWSTLGWFKDPILSSMLNRNPGQIANLIIHELTHGTVYVKSSVDFNENLASFIGDKGAERFLAFKFGSNSAEAEEYKRSKSDRKIYNAYVLQAAQKLDSLYRTFLPNESVMHKETKKMEFIYQTISGLNKLNLYHKKSYLAYTNDALIEKNAFFMSFRRYDSEYDVFDKEFREHYHSDIRLYIQALVKRWN
jgi:predicted aminopeptidase